VTSEALLDTKTTRAPARRPAARLLEHCCCLPCRRARPSSARGAGAGARGLDSAFRTHYLCRPRLRRSIDLPGRFSRTVHGRCPMPWTAARRRRISRGVS